MWAARLAIVAVMISNQLIASGLDLCVENPDGLDRMTLQSFRTELGAILAASGRPANFTACLPVIVTITLRDDPPEEEPTALGATRVRNGRLVPEIELYVSPIAQIVATRLPGVLGRALARVATHELGHLLSQGSAHTRHGVMMERLSAAHLMAADRSFFRLPPIR